MGLVVPLPIFMIDVVLFLAMGYAIFFLLKRINRYSDPNLNDLVLYSAVFLIIGELGRITDIIDDFCCRGAFDNFQYATYFIAIVGVIYTVLNYIRFVEMRYVPTIGDVPEIDHSSRANVVFSRSRFLEVVGTLKKERVPILAITRSPEIYKGFEEGLLSIIWVSQVEKGVSPTALHVIQGIIHDFVRKKPGSVVVIDCLEYLLLYNDFRSVFKFLTNVKDYVVFQGKSRMIVFVDGDAISEREKSILLKEFEPL